MAFTQTQGEAWRGPAVQGSAEWSLSRATAATPSHIVGRLGPAPVSQGWTGVPGEVRDRHSICSAWVTSVNITDCKPPSISGAAHQGPTAPGRMVRILANGEIVQDDDPRVRTTTQPPRGSIPRQSFFNRGHGAPPGGPGLRQQQAGARLGAAQSPFNDLNRQLVNMGFPQWHLGNHAVEPVTSILLLFLLMMLGVRGLLLVGLVYLVSHLSQR
ncbi:protein FAM241B isoform X2 [Gorilla gorilla gorilla]|uniref:protein FAM241B isoform X2 n=1 Tax=Gorilla gorilla gorilla TaxID=9595 RepID=UPI0008F46970|nr:protein FAM241B isoform X2 [Gorilla gorilla gorilla]